RLYPSATNSIQAAIDLFLAAGFQPNLAFRVCEIKMRYGFRDREEAMNVVRLREHFSSNIPRRCALLRNQTDHVVLPFADSPYVAVEELIIITNWFPVASVNKCGRKRS